MEAVATAVSPAAPATVTVTGTVAGASRIGKYVVLRQLGEGGMGIVVETSYGARMPSGRSGRSTRGTSNVPSTQCTRASKLTVSLLAPAGMPWTFTTSTPLADGSLLAR